jgi:general secretion pathway protein G
MTRAAAAAWIPAAILTALTIAGMFSGGYVHSYSHARAVAARDQIDNFLTALDAYRSDTGHFPSESQGLAALRTNPGEPEWDGPYMLKDIPSDPWGVPYRYTLVDGRPLIVSLGGGTEKGERAISSTPKN